MFKRFGLLAILIFTFTIYHLPLNIAAASGAWSIDLVSAVDGTDGIITTTPGATINLRGIVYGDPVETATYKFYCGSTVAKSGTVIKSTSGGTSVLINDLNCTLPTTGALNPKLIVKAGDQEITESLTVNFTYGNPGTDRDKEMAREAARNNLALYVGGILLTILALIIYYTRNTVVRQY